MRRVLVIVLAAFVTTLLLASPMLGARPGPGGSSVSRTFVAPLSGAEVVPPADTLARGNAVFRLNEAEDELHFRLVVANIHNVTMAHIHLGPPGVNGPVVVWLYPMAPPPDLIEGRSSGVLATGTITADDLVGPLAGEQLSALMDWIRAGDTYVHVHTAQFPGGELRGQTR